MSTTITLEKDWYKKGEARQLIPEGDYSVVIEELSQDGQGRLKGIFAVSEEGHYHGWSVHETFNLESYPTKFYEMLAAAGVQTDAESVDVSSLKGVTLVVSIRHRKDDSGKLWANISQFMTA